MKKYNLVCLLFLSIMASNGVAGKHFKVFDKNKAEILVVKSESDFDTTAIRKSIIDGDYSSEILSKFEAATENRSGFGIIRTGINKKDTVFFTYSELIPELKYQKSMMKEYSIEKILEKIRMNVNTRSLSKMEQDSVIKLMEKRAKK